MNQWWGSRNGLLWSNMCPKSWQSDDTKSGAMLIHKVVVCVTLMCIQVRTDISTEDIHKAEIILQKFYTLAPKLYPLKLYSSVTHSLFPIPQFVHTCRPLWSYSIFGLKTWMATWKSLVMVQGTSWTSWSFHTRWNLYDSHWHICNVQNELPLLKDQQIYLAEEQRNRYVCSGPVSSLLTLHYYIRYSVSAHSISFSAFSHLRFW